MEKQVETKRHLPNKYIYTVFLSAAIVLVFLKDFSTAIVFAGIGLVFDPFNQSVPFPKRPLWQRIWLVVHCVFVFVVLWLSIKFR